jgi:hypothetical protein
MAGPDSDALTAPAATHPAVGDPSLLLETLRSRDRLRIGVDRHIAVSQLLERLAASGIVLRTPDAAADWLAPVLCTSARDSLALRDRLRARFAAMGGAVRDAARLPAGDQAVLTEQVTPQALETADRAVRTGTLGWRWALAGVALLGALALGVLNFGAGGAPVARPEPVPLPPWLAATLLAVLTLGTLGAAAAVLGRRALLARQALPSPDLPVNRSAGLGLPWFGEGRLRTSLRALRRHVPHEGAAPIDVARSVAATVRQAGVPMVVRAGRPRLPEHLLLVGLANPADALRLPAEALARRLADAGAHVSAYAYLGDPGLLRRLKDGARLTLARAMALHGGARLLLVADAASLFDELAGAPVPPPELRAVRDRVLLTPVPQARWAQAEHAFHEAGWLVVELSAEGVERVAAMLTAAREARPIWRPAARDPSPDLAERLARQPAVLAPRRAPTEAARRWLITELRAFLRNPGQTADAQQPATQLDGFALLAVLAAGPEAAPGVLERLAAQLIALGREAPPEPVLARLSRLPWLRLGRLPEWLRRDLLDALAGTPLERDARLAWALHLTGETARRVHADGARAWRPDGDAAALLQRLALERLDAATLPASDQLLRQWLAVGAAPPEFWPSDWRVLGAAFAGAAGALLLGLVLWLWGGWLAAPLTTVADFLFAPVEMVGGTASTAAAWLSAVLAALSFAPRNPWAGLQYGWVGRRGFQGFVLYLICGQVWISSGNAPGEAAFAAPALAAAGMMLARRGGILGAPGADVSTPDAESLLRPAHPWATATLVAGLAGVIWGAATLPMATDRTALAALTDMLPLLAFGLLAALGLALRLVSQALPRAQALRAAAAALASGLLSLAATWLILSTLEVTRASLASEGFREYALQMLLADLMVGAGLIGALRPRLAGLRLLLALLGGLLPPATVLVLAVVGPTLPTIGDLQLGLVALLLVPWRGLGLLVAFLGEGVGRSGAILPLMLVRAPVAVLLISVILFTSSGADAPQLTGFALLQPSGLVLLLLPEWLLLPLLYRAPAVPEAGPRGLWWRCFALLPCWVGVRALGDGFGPLPLLAIPIAIWLAARHGTGALPAIALALAPMAIGYTEDFGPIGLLLGNNLGHALAALLLARFAVDAGFREACLSATRTPPWQLVALALLPLGYASPRFAGFNVFSNPWALVLSVAFLIGLSRAPLRGPLLALLGSSAAAVVAELALGGLRVPEFGQIVHVLRTWPSDLLSVVLVLWLPRRLRGSDPWPRLRPVADLIDNHPAIVAGVMMVFAYMVTVRLVPEIAGRQPTITPFLPVHLLLLSVYWTATKPSGKLFVPMGIFITLPMVVVMLVVMFVPKREIMLGPVLLIVADRGVGSTLGAILVLWVFNVLGLLLDGTLRGANAAAHDVSHPAFATLPVRIGTGLAVVALAVLLVMVGTALTGYGVAPPEQGLPLQRPDSGSTGGGF